MLSKNVERLLAQRYYQPGENWPALVRRVVNHVCADESEEFKYRIYELMHDRVFLPNSPCLVNAGKEKSVGLFACFVVGPTEDTLEAHYRALGDIADVGKAGGGAGFTGTFIRAEGSPVAGSAHGFAYGPNAWAVQVNNYLDMITQGGFRKMALMYALDCDHPDIEKFIDLKQTQDETFARRFNQSVMADDTWMQQAIEQPDSSEEGRLLKKIAQNAWNNGEPGLLFSDTINNDTPYQNASCRERIYGPNPCGEQCLPVYGSCNLGSINIAHDIFFNPDGSFNFDQLWIVTSYLTQFLDNVGMKNTFPNEKFHQWYKRHRPIGVGIMGYADALLRLGLAYGEDLSLDFLEEVLSGMYEAANTTSHLLGRIRGVPAHCEDLGRRNITLLSIAPTGSISFIAECSSGIEPDFTPEYTRTDERGETYTFKHMLADEPYYRSALNDDLDKQVTTKQHVDVQIAAQKYVDSAVSKTINMPNDATVDDVLGAMIYAYRNGCKGITVYRDGSRQIQVLRSTKDGDTVLQKIMKTNAPKRPESLPCRIAVHRVKGDPWTILIGFLEGDPYEVFAFPGTMRAGEGLLIKRGKGVYDLLGPGDAVILENVTGSYHSDEEQALTRAISLALRHGADPQYVVEQLDKAEGTVVSFSKALRRALSKYINFEEVKTKVCEQCGSESIVMQEGCETCRSCGYSKCG